MNLKLWRRLPPPPVGFADALALPPFYAHLLYNRGVRRRAEVEAFLAADSRLLNDPMLLPDMDKAVARLKSALERGETIGVFGDFDADGITGTALLMLALRDLGAQVVPYIPDRVEEGHGLNEQAILYLKQQGVSLLLTVDCGVASVAEVALASSLAIDTIITDHHTILPALPQACAVINPRRPESAYPYPHLTGVGMAFKLVEALYGELGVPWPGHLLEMVALGTVADVGPLTGENRYFVKKGLQQLNSTSNPGLQALIASAGLKPGSLDTESLAFGLIPRLNVAGRLDHASLSLALLTATSHEEAQGLAEELERRNRERQSLTEQAFQEAIGQVEAMRSAVGVPSILVVSSREWLPGILGLIASRLTDHYYRPAIAITLGNEVSRASARSIPEFNMMEALRQCGELFVRYGGHPQAAGFAIPTPLLPQLSARLESLADASLLDKELTPYIYIDCEVGLKLFSPETCGFIQGLSPFGQGNPAPVFLTRSARVYEARQVGGNGNHLKLRVWHNGSSLDAIAFRQGQRLKAVGSRIDMVYTVGLDTWSDRTKVQLTVIDFRQSA